MAPGFRQTNDSESRDPRDPKWEGFLIASVKDPVKELSDTKDAYVSYLVSAKVYGSSIEQRLNDVMKLMTYLRLICQATAKRHLRAVDVSATSSFLGSI